jgi:3-hydroxyacyl-CoA dehydrogenase/enoyl-CoA hydratase/3-hydroxybutyryl-CoA epimerase
MLPQMSSIRFEVDANGIALVSMDVPQRSMNVLTAALIQDLRQALELIASTDTIRGAILTSGKASGFLAGGDLTDLVNAFDSGMTAADGAKTSREISGLYRRLETCGKPVAAAINGHALGGGLELCLACHYRVLSDDPKLRLGLPEVNVGLLPGAGGTQRLPRLVGIPAALPLLLKGKTIAPQEAMAAGIVHGVMPANQLVESARRWLLLEPNPVQPWDTKDFKVPGGVGPLAAHAGESFIASTALIVGATGTHYPAPLAILSSVFEGTQVSIDAGLRIESKYFGKLLADPVARNLMRTLFINKGVADKRAARSKDSARSKIARVGIVGAGSAGRDLSLINTRAGITTTVEGDLGEAEVVIEVADDTPESKRDAISWASAAMSSSAVLASTSTTLPVATLAQSAARPQNFIGLHLFSPIETVSLVEVVRGRATSEETVTRTLQYAAQLGKTPILVADSPGFFVPRVFAAFRQEGQKMVEEGVTPALIENSARAAGFTTGPLAVLTDQSRRGKTTPVACAQPQSAELQLRFLTIMALESWRCLDEGVIQDAATADLGSVLGAGFPSWTGGTLSYIDTLEIAGFVYDCQLLADRCGTRFEPSASLSDRARLQLSFHPKGGLKCAS